MAVLHLNLSFKINRLDLLKYCYVQIILNLGYNF